MAERARTYILHGGPADGRTVTIHEGRYFEVSGWRYDLHDPKDATCWIEYFNLEAPRG